MAPSEALPRRPLSKRHTPEENQRGTNGWFLKSEYKKWLRDTPEGRDEAQAVQQRLAALKETWERKGI